MTEGMSHKSMHPTSDRLVSLDVLRGFAVLGILVMNIQSYAMISAAYLNPTAYGDLTGLNKIVWIFSHLFTDQKFMTLFSLLFGTGIILFVERLQSKGAPAMKMHYRRTIWLLVFGMVHAYLLWYGDILFTYAICALTVVLLRKLSAKVLVVIGLFVLAVPSLLYLFFGLSWNFIPPEAQQSILISWQSTPELINKEVAIYQSGYIEQMSKRIPDAINFQIFIFLIFSGWRAAGLMIIGMAFFKWGIVTAKKSKRFYIISVLIGLVIGIPVIVYGILKNFEAGWIVNYSMFLGSQYNYWGSLFLAYAYISIIMLIVIQVKNGWITKSLSAVGRMALTNYLLQSVIGTFIFYGHGLGLYGTIERAGQALIVISIWILQLVLSPLWLKYFRFGPAEWLWRSLTYWKRQPMRLQS